MVLWQVFRGIGLPPVLTRSWRGLVEAALTGAIGAVTVDLTGADWGDYAKAAPIVFIGLNWLEGVVDQIDPEKKRA